MLYNSYQRSEQYIYSVSSMLDNAFLYLVWFPGISSSCTGGHSAIEDLYSQSMLNVLPNG